MPKFSIIIPVYNVAPYLRECLDSVLAQTYTDWEAICVDDGSTDGSGAILDEYALKDNRFKVLHQKNQGVSAARNVALDAASGEYLVFVDSDDFMDDDYLEYLFELTDGKEQIGAICWQEVNTKGEWIKNVVTRISTGVYEKITADEILGSGCMGNKAIPLSLLRKRNVRFASQLHFSEDAVFLIQLLSGATMRMDSEYHGYHYRIRPRSLCHGQSQLDAAICYWDDLKYLAVDSEVKVTDKDICEFAFRSTVPHMVSMFSFGDVRALVRRICKDGTEAWKSVRLLSGSERRRTAARYAKIIMSNKCGFRFKAVMLWMYNWIVRCRRWLQVHIFGCKIS